MPENDTIHIVKDTVKPSKATFIILTHNSLNHLTECINYINKQRVTKNIVVIDGGSHDGTWEYAKLMANVSIRSYTNLAEARNVGIKTSASINSEYTVFVDSDVILPEGWFSDMLKLLKHYDKTGCVASISSNCMNYPRNHITKAIDSVRKVKGVTFTNSGFMQSSVWRTDAIKDLRADTVWSDGGEDLDLFYKATQKGYSHLVTDKPTVKHYGPSGLRALLKKSFKYGMVYNRVLQRIPTQRSAWNTYKKWYWPAVALMFLLEPRYLLGGVFLSPYVAYSWYLYRNNGDFGPDNIANNGLKFQAMSLGMATSMLKQALRKGD